MGDDALNINNHVHNNQIVRLPNAPTGIPAVLTSSWPALSSIGGQHNHRGIRHRWNQRGCAAVTPALIPGPRMLTSSRLVCSPQAVDNNTLLRNQAESSLTVETDVTGA